MVSCRQVLDARVPCAVLAGCVLFFAIVPGSPAQTGQPKTPAEAKELPLGLGVRCVAFSPDGTLLAATLGTPEERGRVVLWDVAKRKQLWLQTTELGVPAVAFSPNGKTLAIGGYDHIARLLDTGTGRTLKTFEGHENIVRGVAFSPDGKTLATGGWDQTVKLWDVASATVRKTLDWPGETLFALSFSPNGQWLLASQNPLRIWDVASGTVKRVVESDRDRRWAVFVDDHWLLAGDGADGLALLSVATGEERLRIDGGSTNRIAYSARAGRLATAGGRAIELFDFGLHEPSKTEKERFAVLLSKLDDDDYAVREAAGKDMLAMGFVIEPELRRVVKETKSVEVRVRCRRLRAALLGNPRATLTGHTGDVEGLAFSPDGRLLASGSLDGSVRLWSTSEATEIARWVPKSK